MKLVFFTFFLHMIFSLSGQKNDYNILVGYRSSDTVFKDYRGITRFDFNTASLNPKILYDSFNIMDYDLTVNNMSDSNGNYLFSYNGFVVVNKLNKIMQNGLGGFTRQTSVGDVAYQGGLILPYNEFNKFILFHEYEYIYPQFGGAYFADGLNYSIIDMNKDNGHGSVIEKNKTLIKDTLDIARNLAIKHANGRDWWIIKGRHDMLSFYTFLISKDTILKYGLQQIGDRQYIPYGCVAISPNGDKLVFVSQHEGVIYGQGGKLGLYLHFFEFDRCSGLLSNPKTISIDNRKSLLLGGAFSQSGRFFYLSRIENIYQIDLANSNLELDTVAKYDGFSYIANGNFMINTFFGLISRLADGRIYGSTSSGDQQYVFYINKPNEKGIACDVRQHAIKITDFAAFPDFPNYRLGPIDGSTCDTLGINNVPVAEFRYDQDTSQYLKMEFTDLSYHEPKEWYWDFGDPGSFNNTSNQINPVHVFSKNGLYNVCLIVKNQNGSDTICKLINIGTVSTENKEKYIPDITFSPNPFKDYFVVNVIDYNPRNMIVELYNSIGEKKLSKRIYQGGNFINVDNLLSGIYFVSFIENDQKIKSDILIKI